MDYTLYLSTWSLHSWIRPEHALITARPSSIIQQMLNSPGDLPFCPSVT